MQCERCHFDLVISVIDHQLGRTWRVKYECPKCFMRMFTQLKEAKCSKDQSASAGS